MKFSVASMWEEEAELLKEPKLPPRSPVRPILSHFASIGGLSKMLANIHSLLDAQTTSVEERAMETWLIELQYDLNHLPNLALAFVQVPECVAMLLNLARNQSLESYGGRVSDLTLCHVAAVHELFLNSTKPQLENSLLVLQHGALDRFLLKLGQVQAEEPRRPERAYKFQLLPAVVKAGQATTLVAETTRDEQQQHEAKKYLWKPGYGTGFGDVSLKQDQEREFHQAGKTAVSLAVIDFLTLFIHESARTTGADSNAGFWQDLYATLEASCLLKVFVSYFFQTTSQAVMANLNLYIALLELVKAIASVDALSALITLEDNTSKPLSELLTSLQQDVGFDEDEHVALRELIASTCALAQRAAQKAAAAAPVSRAVEQVSSNNDEEHKYAEAMRAEIFKDMDMTVNGRYTQHHYQLEVEEDAKLAGSKTRERRMNRELKALRSTLPLHFGSTIALRFDRQRPFVGKFIIFAPSNTPYDSGAFLFDFFCGNDYPNEPPKVNLETTGGSYVRFNPNLYQNGKVCLSILGTWRGGANGSENWNAEHSTLLQVLVSIQSAILGSEFPYFNEPTVETQWGSAEGELQKRIHVNGGYERLRVATITHAMTAQILSPPPGFEDCIKLHFQHKREYIEDVVCAKWLEEAASSDTKGHLQALQQAVDELKSALRTL